MLAHVLPIAWCVLAACGSEGDVRSERYHDRKIAAPVDMSPRPWGVGQWAVYKASSKGSISYLKQSIVAHDACGVWIELAFEVSSRRNLFKACLRMMPDPRADADAQFDQLEAVMMREGNRTIVMDFRNGQNPRTKALMRAIVQGSPTLLWQSEPSQQRSDVVVPAGQFLGAARVRSRYLVDQSLHTVDAWVHPEVPISGILKAVVATGDESVLLDYGLIGARSELPGFDEHLREVGLE